MYSQHREDEEIAEYLIKTRFHMPNIVVDIGAGDGLFLSNSRLFIEKHNFNAYLVEPNPEQFFQLQDLYRLYPPINAKVECLNLAIAGSEYCYEMKNNGHWTIGTVEPSEESSLKTVTLSKLFEDKGINLCGILFVDTEGKDTEIITEFMANSQVRPHMIMLEGEGDAEFEKQRAVLNKDYIHLRSFSFNHLFVNRKCV